MKQSRSRVASRHGKPTQAQDTDTCRHVLATRLLLKDEELSYCIGKEAATQKKLEKAAGCILQFIGNIGFIAGTRAQRRRCKEFISWLLQQMRGSVTISDISQRDDATEMYIPANCKGWVTGNRGSELRRMEQDKRGRRGSPRVAGLRSLGGASFRQGARAPRELARQVVFRHRLAMGARTAFEHFGSCRAQASIRLRSPQIWPTGGIWAEELGEHRSSHPNSPEFDQIGSTSTNMRSGFFRCEPESRRSPPTRTRNWPVWGDRDRGSDLRPTEQEGSRIVRSQLTGCAPAPSPVPVPPHVGLSPRSWQTVQAGSGTGSSPAHELDRFSMW